MFLNGYHLVSLIIKVIIRWIKFKGWHLKNRQQRHKRIKTNINSDKSHKTHKKSWLSVVKMTLKDSYSNFCKSRENFKAHNLNLSSISSWQKTKASYHSHTCLSKRMIFLRFFSRIFINFYEKWKLIFFQIHYDECNIKMIVAYADQIARV